MSLNETPLSERLHIGIFGKRNAGKSSMMNALTGQAIAIVSDVLGTTTDPVLKTMELLPLGPVVFVDTPGFDDESILGKERIEKSSQMLRKTDLLLVVIDAVTGKTKEDLIFLEQLEEKKLSYLIVYNKADLLSKDSLHEVDGIYVSTYQKESIEALKKEIINALATKDQTPPLVSDLVSPSDFVVLVVPIDKAAPKGRLILPQQQTIRDLLDSNAVSIVVKEYELKETLSKLGQKPKLVITDSQVFQQVAKDTPADVLLTSFSILFARYKGNLSSLVAGVTAIDSLKDGDRILISEGCTHHKQCDDIGTVKLPKWILQYTGKDLIFEYTSGTQFSASLSSYQLIVHCGGCMLNEREMKYRLAFAEECTVPMTNYGILIAYMHGILKRSLEPFPEIEKLLEGKN